MPPADDARSDLEGDGARQLTSVIRHERQALPSSSSAGATSAMSSFDRHSRPLAQIRRRSASGNSHASLPIPPNRHQPVQAASATTTSSAAIAHRARQQLDSYRAAGDSRDFVAHASDGSRYPTVTEPIGETDQVMATASSDESDTTGTSNDDETDDAWSSVTRTVTNDVATRYGLLDSVIVDMADRIRLRRLLSQAQAGRNAPNTPPYHYTPLDDLISNTAVPARDFQLPGLVGTRPLNPTDRNSAAELPSRRAPLSRQPSHLKEQQWPEETLRQQHGDGRTRQSVFASAQSSSTAANPNQDSHVHDQSSATSISSFLQPGVVFVGRQTFEAKGVVPIRSASDSRRAAHAPLSSIIDADPLRPLAPPSDFPSLPSSRSSGLDAFLRRPAATRPGDRQQAHDGGGGGGHPVFSSYDNSLRQGLWSDLSTVSIATVSNETEAKRQQWGVKVIINSVSNNNDQITGLMKAIGVPSSPHDITTFFTGELINPIVDGLRSRQWSSTIRMSTELEYWARIGPFRGMQTSDLAVQAHDFHWLRDKTRGWVLMRWKEKEFINVNPSACSLSIDGFYLVALDRSTGQLEGLYCDPSTPPFQRLSLKPDGFAAPFALGTFAMS
ncbi:hypothetical protein OIV83_000398 [Microbotryomycetes sp. JL201]|nr:hypothetical protein OIV83_000398 [Microbotryomycetes sp. JL201]